MIDTIETAATTHATEAPALLRRRLARHTQRRVAFYDPASATLALDTGRSVSLTLDGDRASDLLGFLASLPNTERPRTVFLCGGDSAATTPPVVWWQEPVGYGWTLSRWHNAADRRTGVYEREGITIDLRMAAPWFGGTGPALDPITCLAAWRTLLRQLRGAFGQQVTLLTTPSMTGLELFEASLPYGLTVETLSAELREHLTHVTTQGRRELFRPGRGHATPRTPQTPQTLGDLWEIDARWMYAACLHNLPTGPVTHDARPEFAGYVPGFYLVQAQVPADWRHIGLLPDLASLESPEAVSYPRRPRQRFYSFATGAEVQLALQQGWRLAIQQRILWPETGRAGRPDVAKTWIAKLKAIRDTYQLAGGPVSQLGASAVRHLVIDVVGRWYAREREEHGILPLSRIDALPSGAIPHIERDLVLWERAAPVSDDWLRYSHPEWAAMVWGRARARLAAQALAFPFESLVALRTDGIWTTANPDAAGIGDGDPRPGAWRVKSYLPGPSFWPRSEAELVELMRRARGHDAEE